ncbi:hypothetical protein OHD16_27140 [Sphingobacterium sp. ML3W]|uniref:hypothetical protein n=1 Tax=Sphingobacterium sp. ML3W TaxID=1538644 RepID=UPI00249AB68D|nr:hypothetical protein [Sphingobacterium sp. ML3W]WFA78379.1 hypothetical protein OGI71_20280 [Sphingobacterium sp. ML3W]
MTENQHHINKCKELIEEKVGWGSSAGWQSQDFDNLSELIYKETNVVLSTSTLKRIWGKVQYNSNPNLSTLDALAKFSGFSNWRSLISSIPITDQNNKEERKRRPRAKIVYGCLILLILTGFLIGVNRFRGKSRNELSYRKISFSSKPVTTGVPNTVIFEYDASHSNADSVFIQQNWDSKRRVKVDKNRHEHASTYYRPGYYRAKLVLNDSIVKEHDIFIESEDWMGFITKEPVPIYLPKEMIDHGDWQGLKQQDLPQNTNNYNSEIPEFVLTQVSRGWNIDSKNFTLSLAIQNTYRQLNVPCQQSGITLLGTDGIIMIPLSKPGCVGELQLWIGEQLLEGATNNLSAFGVDFSSPVSVKCISNAGKIKIELNDKLAYQGLFLTGIGKIVGVRVSFQGSGLIKSFDIHDTAVLRH